MNRDGKRVAENGGAPKGGRSGLSAVRLAAFLISLALIISAACIVVSFFRSTFQGRDSGDDAPVSPVESAVSSQEPDNGPVVIETPAPAATPAPVISGPVSFALNRVDFTLRRVGETFQMQAFFTPADSAAAIIWKSSDPKAATVSETGLVTAVAPGTVTITAQAEGLAAQSCIVRCNFPVGGGANLALNRRDFTLRRAGETWKLVVSGAESKPVWSVSNPGVATVAGDGTVTAVAPGVTTVTATVDGVSLRCTVRCRW